MRSFCRLPRFSALILTGLLLSVGAGAQEPVPMKPAASASPQIQDAKTKAAKAKAAAKAKGAKAKAAAEAAKVELKESDFPIAGQDDCKSGVFKDDGTVEGGMGFQTNMQLGEIVQRFDSSRLAGKAVAKVCVGLFSNGVDNMAFEIVFYADQGGRPADEPYASVAAQARDLPKKMKDAGRFYSVDIKDVKLVDGPSFIGVRWNPKLGRRGFAGLDKTARDGSTPTPTFYRDSKSPGWEDLLTSKDFLYNEYQASLIRVVPVEAKKK